MKIAMIGLRGIPAKTGGVENVVEHLAPLLVELGCDVTVYCRSPYCPDREKVFRGVKLRYLPTINTKYTETLTHTLLSTTNASAGKYDIVHYHAMGNGLFSFIPRLAGKKTVVTLHGLDYEREKWGALAKAFLRISETVIASFPNKVISVSEKIRQHYEDKFKKNIEYIPNGVDILEPLQISRLKRFGLEEKKYILYLGRIVPEKEIHTLIRAFRNISTEQKLVIAGDATHTETYFEKLKELAGNDSRIIFTGPLYGDDKTEAISNCSFFVLPSTIEGMPIALLEAMSFSRCALVSDIQENLSVIGKNGFSFRTRDVLDLQKKMEYILSHPQRAERRGIKAKKEVEKRYNWQSIARKTLKVYEEALRGTQF